jgi:hypothetical protein
MALVGLVAVDVWAARGLMAEMNDFTIFLVLQLPVWNWLALGAIVPRRQPAGAGRVAFRVGMAAVALWQAITTCSSPVAVKDDLLLWHQLLVERPAMLFLVAQGIRIPVAIAFAFLYFLLPAVAAGGLLGLAASWLARHRARGSEPTYVEPIALGEPGASG